MNRQTQNLLMKILGELIFRNDSPAWRRLDDAGRNEILELAEADPPNLMLFLYFYLHEELPVWKRREYALLFQQHNLAVRNDYWPVLQAVQKKFRDWEADYILLKGAYLSDGVYPHPVLRVRGDIDVLVRSTSALRLHRALVASGGVFFGSFSRNHKHLPAIALAGQER